MLISQSFSRNTKESTFEKLPATNTAVAGHRVAQKYKKKIKRKALAGTGL